MASRLISTELAKLEKLNGTNYDMWHRKIKYGMIHDGIEYVIYEIAPELNDSPTDGEIKKMEQWISNDKKTRSLILMFMEDNLINFFETYETAQEM